MIVGIFNVYRLATLVLSQPTLYCSRYKHRAISSTEIILHHYCIAALEHGVGVMIAIEIHLLNTQGDFTV